MKQRLLLVDDDEVFLRPLHRTLELAGYEVLPVQSAEEALDTLKAEDVDLVLTDRRLPGMDGVGLVRHVKAEHADLAVVVMTAYGSIESAVEAMRLGAEDYLVKPFETPELLLVIRRAIEFQALKSANRRSIRRNQERFTFRNIYDSNERHIVFTGNCARGINRRCLLTTVYNRHKNFLKKFVF